MKNKIKTLLLASILFTSCCAEGAQVLLNHPYDSGGIVSLVNEYEKGIYTYTYTFDKNDFFQYRDLSNFYFYVCDNVEIFNIQTENISNFNTVRERGYFKFDDIDYQNNGPVVTVMFDSPNIPKFGEITYKYATNVMTEMGITPSCQIPEPNLSFLGLIGGMLLINRRKR